MLSKTSQFDKALDEILSNLKPGQKTCQQCDRFFDIFQEDIEFYKKLRVPPPFLCPDCRKQRRFGFYNNILKFYKKSCLAHPGEKIISTFSPESPYKIFDLDYWWSDKWGGDDYARDYYLNKSFFEQFKDFNFSVPHQAMLHYQKGVVDSPYTIDVIYAKNCYLIGVTGWTENLHYSYWVVHSKDSMELLTTSDCENSYECINSLKCYKCFFCQNCRECVDSYFLFDCRNCVNCFGCANIRHKSYCFFNEQLSKEEYQKRIQEINLGNRDILEEYKDKFEKFFINSIRRNVTVDRKNINCLGDNLMQSKNCYQAFRAKDGNENVRYSTDFLNVKDSMDVLIAGPNLSLSYEVVSVFGSNDIKFSYAVRDSLNLGYCLECFNCQDCFGCVGLHNKKHHIFNKLYSEEDYWNKLDEIKTKMLGDGEYGEFFPLSMSLHPYNNTYAIVEFPLTKEQVLANGWQWYDEPKIAPDLKKLELIEIKDVPRDIREIKDDILNKAIVCEITGKPFRIIKSELDFYREHNLPIPTKHPFKRMMERFQKRNPSKLWKAICDKCGREMFTSYPPEKQKELKIYCEKCYLKEFV